MKSGFMSLTYRDLWPYYSPSFLLVVAVIAAHFFHDYGFAIWIAYALVPIGDWLLPLDVENPT
jgi:hypothetical protein